MVAYVDYIIRQILIVFAIIILSLIVLFQFYKCYIIFKIENRQSIVPDDQSANIEKV